MNGNCLGSGGCSVGLRVGDGVPVGVGLSLTAGSIHTDDASSLRVTRETTNLLLI